MTQPSLSARLRGAALAATLGLGWALSGQAALAGAASPALPGAGIQRSLVQVALPDVRMLRHDGRTIALREAVDDGRPVLLNFTFTSCSTVCPVSAQVFSQVREQLGADRERVHLVSVSIDAAFDTVPRLRDYAERLRSGATWSFLTGQEADSVAVQKAFQAWRGDKMNHLPVTYLRPAPGRPWIRLEGLIGPDQLTAEVRAMLEAPRVASRL
jgi:protein SCO1/2